MRQAAFLFTCDLHNRLTPQVAARLRSLKAAHQALLLDGGDAISATNVTVPVSEEPVLALMDDAGYDAMVMGNREYFIRQWGIRRKLAGVRFPILAANITFGEGIEKPFRPWIIADHAGHSIGIIGLAREMVHPGGRWARITDAAFVPWPDVARRAAEELRRQVSMVVVLSHLGRRANSALAEEPAGIDLILAGHEHPRTVQTERVGPCTVVYVPAHAKAAALVQTAQSTGPYEFEVSEVDLR